MTVQTETNPIDALVEQAKRVLPGGSFGNLPLGIGGNVQAPRPNAHRRSMPGRGRQS